MKLKVRIVNLNNPIGKWENEEWLTFNVTKTSCRRIKSAIQELAKRGKFKVKFTYDQDAGVLWAKNLGKMSASSERKVQQKVVNRVNFQPRLP